MNLHFKPNRRYRGSNVTINIFPEKKEATLKEPVPVNIQTVNKNKWFINVILQLFVLLKRVMQWLWKHPKKLITTAIAALLLWLSNFLNIKLPSLPFLPIPAQQSKQVENKKEDTKQPEQTKTNIVTNTITQTNVVTQTNTVTKTNYVTETKYVTNFVVQPIVVTNTVFKEVPITVTNVLVIKNNTTDTNTNNNKNGVINGPAFFFTDDFNTLLQNPIRGRTVN